MIVAEFEDDEQSNEPFLIASAGSVNQLTTPQLERIPAADVSVLVVREEQFTHSTSDGVADPELQLPRTIIFLPGDLTPQPMAEVIISTVSPLTEPAVKSEPVTIAPSVAAPDDDLWVKSQWTGAKSNSYASPSGTTGLFRAP